jgi:hypothetical protein
MCSNSPFIHWLLCAPWVFSSDLDGRGAFTFDVLPGYAIPMLNECGVASVTSRKCVEHVSKNGIQPDLTQI